MKHYQYLIRQESFGAIIFNYKTGANEFINKQELNSILEGNGLNLWNEKVSKTNSRFVKKIRVSSDYFSAPNSVYLELTTQCNLQCAHCFNSSGRSKVLQWNKKDLFKLIKELSGFGVFEIRFTGGEPLMHPHITEVIKYASSLGIYCSLGTNGTIITKAIAQKLKKAGLMYAIVSIEGTKMIHKKIRGENNYEKSIAGLKNLLKNKIKVRINMTVMQSNKKDIEKIISLAESLKTDIVLRRFIPIGNSLKNTAEMLSPSEYASFNGEVNKYKAQSHIKIFSHYLERPKTKRIPVSFFTGQCLAGINGCGIRPNGDVLPCGVLTFVEKSPTLGNIKQQSLDEIWNASTKTKKHRMFMKTHLCNKCVKKTNCSGSCAALIYRFKKDPYCINK